MKTAIKMALEAIPAINPLQRTDDSRLVQECLAGSEQAWAALIENYKKLIYSIPFKYGMDRDEAADIFQSVCLELFCELQHVRKTESLKFWLISVTARKCLHAKKQRRSVIDIQDAGNSEWLTTPATASALLEDAQKEQCLRDAVGELSPRCKEMVRLLFYEQPPLPYAEVASRLGLATGSIGFIRARCLDQLEKTLVEMDF
jgi:RNA polymerase sigma factor (sigma-70 family)